MSYLALFWNCFPFCKPSNRKKVRPDSEQLELSVLPKNNPVQLGEHPNSFWQRKQSSQVTDELDSITSMTRTSQHSEEYASSMHVTSSTSVSEELQCKILIVDDVIVNRRILQRLLEGLGSPLQPITQAFDGQDAVEKVIAAQQEENPYHIIFMDINMPRKNGYEATKQILDLYKNMIVIAYTSEARDVCLEKENRFRGHLQKDMLLKNKRAFEALLRNILQDFQHKMQTATTSVQHAFSY